MYHRTQLTNKPARGRHVFLSGRGAAGSVRPYRILACDADGTLTWRRHLAARTAAALVRWREAGGGVILVTGEIRDDLLHFARTGLFDRIVAENGGTLLKPPDWADCPLGPAPPAAAVRSLRRRVRPLRVGRVVVGTRQANENELRRALGRACQLVRNGKDVMALPRGVTKATGLEAALNDLGLSFGDVVGIGNAGNDLSLIRACAVRVAVANAAPELKETADWVTMGRGPDGVIELIRRLLAGHPPRRRRGRAEKA
jgi:hydroxymethylpyrimidine pyrophosphatase-like HAD family hydrolase